MTFIAQSTADVQTVKARLAEVEHDLAEVEATAPAAALRKVLGTATDEDAALLAKLPVLRDERDSLQLAQLAAEHLEAERKEEARARENVARERALVQHLAKISREAVAVASAAENLVSAHARMAEAARSAAALLPPKLQAGYWFQTAMSERGIAQKVRTELARLAKLNRIDPIAGNLELHVSTDNRGSVPSFINTISRITTDAKPLSISPAGAPFPPADEAASDDGSPLSPEAAPIPEEAAA
jgi:hypothetical protein